MNPYQISNADVQNPPEDVPVKAAGRYTVYQVLEGRVRREAVLKFLKLPLAHSLFGGSGPVRCVASVHQAGSNWGSSSFSMK